ncbi:hypothetical protein [Microbacterium immunditiarum]|uniref:Uncharacterized protein n=1 Tax=Microbacterium immunditiarum TaxID=337480 RepID=A0A7Y9GMI0_9MICO|nr:hypothetical protein [Microbacterium immunditiarum]NYE19233.1 hypothetical protein [Microbacterium immunditiarum]
MPSKRRSRAASACPLITVAALATVSLVGCATNAPGADAADPGAIAERANVVGIAPDLVYTTEVDGYELQAQSVGPSAGAGISGTWFNYSTGTMLTIRTDRGEYTAAACEATPLWDASDLAVTCTEEEDGIWHRQGGAIHEYVAVRDEALILVTGMHNAPRDDLRTAARAVHVPSEAELQLLFSDLPTEAPQPVERGDLPENGDGAPVDPVGPGG